MTADAGRYAIYFAPSPDGALDRFGARWLGYDAATGAALPQPALPQFTAARLAGITAEARHYGFHATLKPPFALVAERSRRDLEAALASFASQQRAFRAPPLTLASISGFWALTLSCPCPAMNRLAADCVAQLDPLRAPPSEAELARRRRARLTAAQEALLVRWGYPYVMDEFRFHMTLSARLDRDEGERLRQDLEPLVEALCRDELAVDAVSLFHQPTTDAPFGAIGRYRFGG